MIDLQRSYICLNLAPASVPMLVPPHEVVADWNTALATLFAHQNLLPAPSSPLPPLLPLPIRPASLALSRSCALPPPVGPPLTPPIFW